MKLVLVAIAVSACGAGAPPARVAIAPPAVSNAPATDGTCATLDENDCARRCDSGDRMACLLLGDILTKRHEDARAFAAYDRVCRIKKSSHETVTRERQPKDAECPAVSYAFAARKDFAKAIALLEAACEAHDDPSCDLLMRELLTGDGPPRDPMHALALAPVACADDPSDAGCLVLAAMLESGDGVPKDTGRAAKMFELACSAVTVNEAECERLHRNAPHAIEHEEDPNRTRPAWDD